MNPKPLSKERREEIERELSLAEGNRELDFLADELKEVLGAEQYWLEAVKNAEGYQGVCPWCDSPRDHKPGCLWLLAQEC